MRKYLIVAVAAFTAVAFATVSFAQQPAATMDVSVSPNKAGTKRKPKNSKIQLGIESTDTSRTVSRITVTTARTVKLSTKGLAKCNAEELEQSGSLSVCPRKSRVGKGTARALVGVNTPTPSPLTFDVTAVVTGSRNLSFYLQARELPVNVLAPGRISGRKLTIDVPIQAQQPVTGTWAGLVELDASIGPAKQGKRRLVTTTGCKRRQHPFEVQLTFANNGVSAAGTATAEDGARCR